MTKRVYGSLALQNQSQLKLYDSLNAKSVNVQAPATLDADITLALPPSTGTSAQVIQSDGTGQLQFTHIIDANIASGAAISLNKLAPLVSARILISDQNGNISVSSVGALELDKLTGLTGNIQDAIDAETESRMAAMLEERLARQAADAALEASIQALGLSLESEAAIRESVDANLQAQIDAQTSLVQNFILTVSSKVTFCTEIVTVNEEMLASKKIQLTKAPNLSYSVTISPRDGIPQFVNQDFEVVNNFELSWNNLGLDGLLIVGDVLQVDYYY